MTIIVDTNVPLVANRAAPQASPACVANCAQRLRQVQTNDILVLDEGWLILNEYMHKLHSSGQPGVGDAFLKWVLTNKSNPRRCCWVHLTPQGDAFAEFPGAPDLDGFDVSDRKFVAAACAHPEHPAILNATDSDWWHYRDALQQHGVRVDFVCPDVDFK